MLFIGHVTVDMYVEEWSHQEVCITILVLMQGPLMNWLKVNFSQVFSAWVHLKALRVFTESVLRYVNVQEVTANDVTTLTLS